MDEPVVSIIVPIYNVEPYIGRALDSALGQTFERFELILVNDGSTDRSGAIADDYARRDRRVTVIHQANQGAPAARNAAMARARGRYFYFMDPDDWAEPHMLSDMVALAEAHGAELVITGFYIDTHYAPDAHLTQPVSHPDRVYHQAEAFRRDAAALFDLNLLYPPWNKLYRADYLNARGIRFPDTFWDDFPFNLAVVRDVSRVVVSAEKYYHFQRMRAESETARYRAAMYEKREEEHGWLVELFAYWGLGDAPVREMLGRRYVERLVGCMENLFAPDCALRPRHKRAALRTMAHNPTARTALKWARPRSRMMRWALVPLRMRCVPLMYWEGWYIARVKRKNIKRFAHLKANR